MSSWKTNEESRRASRRSHRSGNHTTWQYRLAKLRARRALAGIKSPVIQMPCRTCLGARWVCEDHPDRPWDIPGGCVCGGAGAPCPSCNVSDRDHPPQLPEAGRALLSARLTQPARAHSRREIAADGDRLTVVERGSRSSPISTETPSHSRPSLAGRSALIIAAVKNAAITATVAWSAKVAKSATA